MESSVFRASPRQVYILPTRFGYMFAATLVLMLLVSVNYNNGLGYLFTFCFAAIGVVSMHYTQRNIVDLSFKTQPGKVVFAGSEGNFFVEIGEHRNRPRTGVWLRCLDDEISIDLDAGACEQIKLKFHSHARGMHRLPEFYALSIYPIGLLCAWTRKCTPTVQQLVYPAPSPRSLLPNSALTRSAETNALTNTGSEEFHNIKEYEITDPISHIHWKHSARGVGMVSKRFEKEVAGDTKFRWKDAHGMNDEERISCLCRWILDAEAAQINYSLEIPGQYIQSGQGAHHMHKCLKVLALWVAP